MLDHVAASLQTLNECQSIIYISESAESDCVAIGDCTGVSCDSSESNVTVEVLVNECTDPLEVNVTIRDDSLDGPTFSKLLSGTGNWKHIGNDYFVNASRNNSFAAVTVLVSLSFF